MMITYFYQNQNMRVQIIKILRPLNTNNIKRPQVITRLLNNNHLTLNDQLSEKIAYQRVPILLNGIHLFLSNIEQAAISKGTKN